MFKKRPRAIVAPAAVFLGLVIGGCTALDTLAPQYAAKPAIPGHPASTTQPAATTQPATTRNVPAQIGTVLTNAAANPEIQTAAAVTPATATGLTIAGIIGGLLVGFFAAPGKSQQGSQTPSA